MRIRDGMVPPPPSLPPSLPPNPQTGCPRACPPPAPAPAPKHSGWPPGVCQFERRIQALISSIAAAAAQAIKFAELVYNGYWFSPEKEFLQASLDKAQEHVTGSVDVRLFKGHTIMRGRSSPFSLYNKELVSMDVEVRAPTTWTIDRHDGPNRLGLPEHQTALITSDYAPCRAASTPRSALASSRPSRPASRRPPPEPRSLCEADGSGTLSAGRTACSLIEHEADEGGLSVRVRPFLEVSGAVWARYMDSDYRTIGQFDPTSL